MEKMEQNNKKMEEQNNNINCFEIFLHHFIVLKNAIQLVSA